MYAIVETGGKQYRVREGQTIKVEKIEVPAGETVELDRVLLVSDSDNVTVGTPYVEGAKVKAKVVETKKDKKVLVFKKKPRKGFKRLRGHRQFYTKLQIENITIGG
ncbi:MAG: 50S ribosomal protein L21 [Nitrospirae bacterium]|nr:MAG: 50S ribosomal protein L21 [Nitrospirota bacterium]